MKQSRRCFVRSALGVATAASLGLSRKNLTDSGGPLYTDRRRMVVLTFDDAVKSHRTIVAPLLKDMGFGATFFVTHRWMDDSDDSLSWEQIAEIHQMGFEIGNHSWTHSDFSVPQNAARLASELALVEVELYKVGVPRPVSFAYSGDGFGPEALRQLMLRGYKFARRGS